MKNSRPLLIVLATITVVGISLGTITFFNRALLEHVYVYNCGIVDYKPQSMTPYCADAGAGVGNLEWDSWGAKGATGTGLYGVNLCDPTCADGKWKFDDVNVFLSKKILADKKTILTRIDIISRDKKNLPQSTSPSLGWDLERKPLISVK
jgi:hypothetical protein